MASIGIGVEPRVQAWDWERSPDFYAIEGTDISCSGQRSKIRCKASIEDEDGLMTTFDLGTFNLVEMLTGKTEFLMENAGEKIETTHLFKEQHVCYEDFLEDAPGINKLVCELPK